MPRPFTILIAAVLTAGGIAASASAVNAQAVNGTAVNGTAVTTSGAVALPATVTGFAAAGPEAGWAIGSSAGGVAQIWHTGSGGATWQRQWQGAGSPVSVTATNRTHAWVLVSCHSSCGRELLGTSDGGGHWRVLTTLPAAVNQVQFGSDGFGVATSDACLANQALNRCPGQLLVSHDGGTHWTVVLTGAGPVFATLNAAGQLWAASTVVGGGIHAVDATFATSTDGGARWHRLGQVSGLGTLSPAVRMTLELGTGGQLAWASMYDQLSCAMHGCGVADLLASGNGRSWRQVGLPDSYPDDCGPIGIALSAGWASITRNGAACSPPLALVYSHRPSGWQQLPPWQLSGITSLTAVSQDVAYAIGDEGVLSRTADGGQHWTQLLPAPVPAGELAASGTGTVFGAQDGSGAGAILRAGPGQAWQQVADLPGVVTQLDFPSSLDGYAATYTPDAKAPWQLWATTDGGTSWQLSGDLPGGSSSAGSSSGGSSEVIDGPWLTADGQGLLLTMANGSPWNPGAGGSGAVREWTTADGGASWTAGDQLPLGKDSLDGAVSFAYASGWAGWLDIANAQYDLQVAVLSGGKLTVLPGHPPADGGVQLVGSGTGFAWDLDYGSHDAVTLVLERTTDGGQRWTRSRLSLPSSASGALVTFANADDGWLVAGSTTWRTSDGGQTWHIV